MVRRARPVAVAIAATLFGAGLLAGPRPAAAVPTYSFTINYPTVEQVIGSTSPVNSQQSQMSQDFGNEVGVSHAFAGAGYGALKGLSEVSVTQPNSAPFPGLSFVAQEESDFALDNIHLVAPTGTDPSTVVTYSVNINLSGGLDVGASDHSYYSAGASAGLAYGTSSSLGGFGNVSLGNATYSTGTGYTASGIFGGLTAGDVTGSTSGISLTHQARATDTISVSLVLSTSATAGYIPFTQNVPPGSAFASAAFAHTAMFSTSGPVFNFDLPGWTANSDDGCIVDNQFYCAPAASIPEPGSAALLLAGLGAMVEVVRRRHTG